MAPDAVLCVQCGYNQKTGKRLKTLGEEGVVIGAGGHASETEKMLARAERELKENPIQQDKGFASESAAWLMAVALALVVGGVVVVGIFFFDYMEGGTVLGGGEGAEGADAGGAVGLGGGGPLLGVVQVANFCGGLMCLVGYIRILIVAFKDELWHGLLAIFCSIYSFVYAAMHWSECGGAVMLWLAGFVVQMVATGIFVAMAAS